LTSVGDAAPIARRLGLTALLVLLATLGTALLVGGVLPASAPAAKCLDCEGEEEEPPGEEELLAYTLTIHVSGIGVVKEGTTTYCQSSTAAGSTCEREVLEGEVVTLTATPGGGMTFTGWGGDCTVTAGACEVTMDEERSVFANFADQTPPATPTITSPTSGQVFEWTAEEPVVVSFTNSGDGSATSFLCRVDVASSAGASSCSPPSWSTGNLPAGPHTVYVWAKDSAGNISSPASRSFEVAIAPPAGEEPPKEEGGTGTGGSDTGGTSTGGSTGGALLVPPKIAARLVAKSHLEGAKTVFHKLVLKQLPAGARVLATCAGRGCPFKRKQPKVKGGVADLSAFFAGRALTPGVLISLKLTAPGMSGQTIDLKVRAGRPPKVTKR
jgi:Divergent InlB B-repeat domain